MIRFICIAAILSKCKHFHRLDPIMADRTACHPPFTGDSTSNAPAEKEVLMTHCGNEYDDPDEDSTDAGDDEVQTVGGGGKERVRHAWVWRLSDACVVDEPKS
jgi:hypothetical protein